MCGIVGILEFGDPRPDPQRIARLTRALAHRGPDEEGVIARGPAVIGNRRLRIIDPEGGRQPLSNEDGTIWVTANCEIYNYRELRHHLATKGHVFRTQSDTEVLVHAYEEWAQGCVERLRGMFAFAVLDERNRALFVARDHFGIKPLYYVQTNEFFAFASELQALRLLSGIDWSLDLRAMDEYLRLQYIPAPRTIYRSVQKLPPASRLTVTVDNQQRARPAEYWRLEFRPNVARSEADTLEELDAVLRESVHAHMAADVPFGAWLSGGVDSSTIVAYMTDILGREIETFSLGFGEPDDEIVYAREAARVCGARHSEEIIRPDALGILPRLVQHYGEPFGDSSAVPTYYLARLARTRVPMVLSGDGGDELFAGYEDSYVPLMRQSRGRPDDGGGSWLERWLGLVQTTPHEWRQKLWAPELRSYCSDESPSFENAFAQAAGLPPCSAAQYLDMKTYLANDILTKVDVASMMHGLEVRTPLVDTRVIEFGLSIPEQYSITLGARDEWVAKAMLKRNAAQWYPRDFLYRPKRGFGLPLARWLGSGTALSAALTERLHDGSSRLREFFVPAALAELAASNADGTKWLLLCLDEWLRYERSARVYP